MEIDGSVEGTALSVAAERGHKELVRWGVLLRCFGARNLAAKLLQVIVETYLLIAQGIPGSFQNAGNREGAPS